MALQQKQQASAHFFKQLSMVRAIAFLGVLALLAACPRASEPIRTVAGGFTPRPRNLACSETMSTIPGGQLFWIIRNGSPGTGMMAYPTLSEDQIWQLVLYVRAFVR